MQSIQSIVTAWYAATLQDSVSRATAEEIAQVEAAVKALPQALGEADAEHPRADAILPWFEAHFHQAPVAQNTPLYNNLHIALEELHAQLA